MSDGVENSTCFVTASIFKVNEDEPVDLLLEKSKRGILLVSNVPEHSQFASTDLRVGDQLFAINNSIVAFSDVETATASLQSISGFLTLLLIRPTSFNHPADGYFQNSTEHTFAYQLCTVAASKQHSEVKAGVSFRRNHQDNSIIISALNDNSIFLGTALSVGDRVISINNIYPKTLNEVLAIAKSSVGLMTLLVAKPSQVTFPPGTLVGKASHDALPKALPVTLNSTSATNAKNAVVDPTQDIAQVLQGLSLGEFEDSFRRNGIESAKDALLLTPTDVKELGVVRIGPRNRLLNWIQEQTSQSSLPQGSPVPIAPVCSTGSVQKIQGIGVCATEVALERPKDQHNPKRVSLAQQAAMAVKQTLQQNFPLNPTNSTHLLRTRLVLASDGSSSGRLWASELGCGHAKFALLWSLESSTSTPLSWNRIQKTDSGGLGFKDFGPGDVGSNAVLKMARKSATEIIQAVSSSGMIAPSSSSVSERLSQQFAYGAAQELGSQAAAAFLG